MSSSFGATPPSLRGCPSHPMYQALLPQKTLTQRELTTAKTHISERRCQNLGHKETTWHGAGCEEPRARRARVGPRCGERPQPRACRDRCRHCSSLGLSPDWKRQSTVIIVINCFISHTTFCLPDSLAARKGRSLSGQRTCRGDHGAHPCTLLLLSFFPRNLGCK